MLRVYQYFAFSVPILIPNGSLLKGLTFWDSPRPKMGKRSAALCKDFKLKATKTSLFSSFMPQLSSLNLATHLFLSTLSPFGHIVLSVFVDIYFLE